MYLSGVNHLKPISFPSETQRQTLLVGKKQWLSGVWILIRFFILFYKTQSEATWRSQDEKKLSSKVSTQLSGKL